MVGGCWRVGDEEGTGGREGGDRKGGRGQGWGGWCEKRLEVKADVNTNAKFLVIVMCDMSHVT